MQTSPFLISRGVLIFTISNYQATVYISAYLKREKMSLFSSPKKKIVYIIFFDICEYCFIINVWELIPIPPHEKWTVLHVMVVSQKKIDITNIYFLEFLYCEWNNWNISSMTKKCSVCKICFYSTIFTLFLFFILNLKLTKSYPPFFII